LVKVLIINTIYNLISLSGEQAFCRRKGENSIAKKIEKALSSVKGRKG